MKRKIIVEKVFSSRITFSDSDKERPDAFLNNSKFENLKKKRKNKNHAAELQLVLGSVLQYGNASNQILEATVVQFDAYLSSRVKFGSK